MAKQKKPPPVHKDKLGQDILQGVKVAVARHNQLRLCSVSKLSPKMIRVIPVNGAYPSEGFQVFGHQTVVVETEDALAFLLRGDKG
jgi:hypothetical protein